VPHGRGDLQGERLRPRPSRRARAQVGPPRPHGATQGATGRGGPGLPRPQRRGPGQPSHATVSTGTACARQGVDRRAAARFLDATAEDRLGPGRGSSSRPPGCGAAEVLRAAVADVDLDRAGSGRPDGHRGARRAGRSRTTARRTRPSGHRDSTAVRSRRCGVEGRQAADRLAWPGDWQDTGLVFTREDGSGHAPKRLSSAFTSAADRPDYPASAFTACGTPTRRRRCGPACPPRSCRSGSGTRRWWSRCRSTRTCSSRTTRRLRSCSRGDLRAPDRHGSAFRVMGVSWQPRIGSPPSQSAGGLFRVLLPSMGL
jgi:hypothetical protein